MFRKTYKVVVLAIVLGVLLNACSKRQAVTEEYNTISDLAYSEKCKIEPIIYIEEKTGFVPYIVLTNDCNGVQREHNKKLNNGLPILHKVPPKRDYGRYFCIMAEKGGTSHGGLTEKLSPFFHAKKQEVNAYGR